MLKGIYLFLIAVLVGIELSIGILVAPTIFYPQNIIGSEILTHFQSGQLMTNIFIKYDKILIFVMFISFVVEIFNLKNKNESFNLKFSNFMLAFIGFALALAFVFYFTDYILEAQSLGEEMTKTKTFSQYHLASEWCMKLMIFSQSILFFLKFYNYKRCIK